MMKIGRREIARSMRSENKLHEDILLERETLRGKYEQAGNRKTTNKLDRLYY